MSCIPPPSHPSPFQTRLFTKRLDLACRYRDGKGVAKDDAAATQWAHRTADAGNAEAMDFVGFAYLRGSVVKGNPAIAVVVDFKYIGPEYPGGSAGHTLNVCGYIAEEKPYILCNPAVATPGLQLITAADLKNFWRSDHYGAISKDVLSPPAFVIENP